MNLDAIRKEISHREKLLRDLFASDFISHDVPDKMPADWCKQKLKLNIPMDMLNIEHLEKVFNMAKTMILERKLLRERESSIMFDLGMISKLETVPE